MECDRHELIGCTICSGQYSSAPAPPKPARPVRHTAPKPADLVLAEQVATGLVCGSCRGVIRTATASGDTIEAIGCPCSRRALYDGDIPDSQDWLEEHEGEFIQADRDAARGIRGARRTITGMALATHTRAARRAGIARDGDMSRAVVERRRLLDRFGVEPKWRAPRTQEADYLPA